MKRNKFLATISSVALMIGNSACMNSDTQISQNDSKSDYIKAQSRQYARGLEQYSLQSIQLITNTNEWMSGAYATAAAGEIIDINALGGIANKTEDYAESGFCVIDPADPREAMHITWFESNDNDEFILNGLGKNSASILVAEMANRVGENALGIYQGQNNVLISGTNANLALPDSCNNLDITEDSPVMISYLNMPQLPDDAVTKTEYTTVACTAGQVGHNLLSIDVTYLSNGSRVVAGQILEPGQALPAVSNVQANTVWNIVEENCQDEIVLTTMATEGVTTQGVNLSMAAGNAVGNAINGNLASIRCREAEVENIEDSPNQDTIYDGGEGQYGENPDDTDMPRNYDTCEDAVDIAAVDNVGDVRLTWLRTEAHTTPCGGSAGNYTDSADGFSGTVAHDIWIGDAVYNREIYRQEVNNLTINTSTGDQGSEYREERERWFGVSISCERQEDLNITCNTGYPALASNTVTDPRGYNYRRLNTINGWLNASSAIPNNPANPAWNFQAGTSGCEWREDDTWTCNVGSEGQRQAGQRERTHTAAALNITPTVGAWNTTQPALCADRQNVSGTCPSGHTGTVTITEERIYTSSTPGSGSWGGWAEVSRNENCQQESGGGNDGGDHGVDVNGDGIGDYGSHSEASNAGHSSGTSVGNCGGCADTSDTDVSSSSSSSSGGGGSGSGGGTVLCTYFYLQGHISRPTYIADMRYARDRVSDEVRNGYHYWAIPLVRYLQSGNRFITEPVLRYVVLNWANEMAFEVGQTKKRTIAGRLIRAIGEPVCGLIGKYVGKGDYKPLWENNRVI